MSLILNRNFKLLIKVFLLEFVILNVMRFLFLFFHSTGDLSIVKVITAFLVGFRLDLAVAMYGVAPFIFFIYVKKLDILTSKPFRFWLVFMNSSFVIFNIIISLIDLGYYYENFTRINSSFFQVISDPLDIIKVVVQTNRIRPFIVASLGMSATYIWLLFRLVRNCMKLERRQESSLFVKIAVMILLVFISGLTIRGGVQKFPLNIRDSYFATRNIYNQLAGNSFYAFVDGYKRFQKTQYTRYYKISEVEKNIRHIISEKGSLFLSKKYPLLRKKTSSFFKNMKKRPNLVFLLLESYDSYYCPEIGGKDIGATKNFSKLAQRSLVLKNFYASGFRSRNALNAIVSGFPSVPSLDDICKHPEEYNNFFSIAKVLKKIGFQTSFICGHSSSFEMRNKNFKTLGFDTLIDCDDFPDASRINFEGISDLVLLKWTNKYFRKQFQKKKPFFSIVFTTQNHCPWKYPGDGPPKLKNIKERFSTRKINTLYYTDFVLGEFFKMAKKEKYYKDTVFIVLGDHSSLRLNGGPQKVENFHIPCLLHNEKIFGNKKKIITDVCSMLDLPSTILDIYNIKSPQASFGRSILAKGERVAFMNMDNYSSLRKGKYFYFNNPPSLWIKDNDKKSWKQVGNKGKFQNMQKICRSYIQLGQYVIRKRRFFPTSK